LVNRHTRTHTLLINILFIVYNDYVVVAIATVDDDGVVVVVVVNIVTHPISLFRLEAARRDLIDSREKIEKQNETLSSYESEINLLQRRVESLENEREKDKKEIARLQEALNRARVVSILMSWLLDHLLQAQ